MTPGQVAYPFNHGCGGGVGHQAQRYFQDVTKTFSTPLARRADASQIQLGYRLVVSVGGGASGTADMVLCEFSTAGHPGEPLALSPTAPLSATLEAPAAIVYDVVQSAVLSVADEDGFERTGVVPLRQEGLIYIDAGPQRQRVFVNPRPAPVKLRVDVAFEFDEHDPDHPPIPRARARRAQEPGCQRAPIRLHRAGRGVRNRVAALDNGRRDQPQSQLADTMMLHLAPSFLVTGHDYFSDRAAGYEAMDASFGAVSEKYIRAKAAIGPIDPIAGVARQAQVEHVMATFATGELRTDPERTQGLIDRMQEPVVEG